MSDRGLWVTWYDLPENDKDAHLAWLHGTYIPRMLKKPGFLFATLYPEEIKWTSGFTPKLLHAPQSPVVGRRLWPAVK